MQKKIVAVSLVILMVALLLASCGNKYLMGEINGVERPLVTDAEGNTELDDEGKIAVYVTDAKGNIQYDADGIEEFYTRKGSPLIYAPISANRYPNTSRINPQDIWTRFDNPSTEYKDANSLLGYMKRWIKEHAYPIYTYTVSMMSNIFKQKYDFTVLCLVGDIVPPVTG